MADGLFWTDEILIENLHLNSLKFRQVEVSVIQLCIVQYCITRKQYTDTCDSCIIVTSPEAVNYTCDSN